MLKTFFIMKFESDNNRTPQILKIMISELLKQHKYNKQS